MSGITSDEISLKELETLYGLMESRLPFLAMIHPAYSKYVSSAPSEKISPVDLIRRDSEKSQSFRQSAEEILDLEPIALSYGLSAPTYAAHLAEHAHRFGKRIGQSSDEVKSLLIGALTIDTIKEYNATVKFVYPNARPYVIDVEGYETPKAGNFIYADGAKMPFKDESFDSVQTNILLHMLERSNLKENEARKRLFKEMHRVLKSDGQLIMVESNLRQVFPNMSLERILDRLTTELKDAGFKKLNILPSLTFEKRSYISKFMRSSHGVLDPNGLGINFHGVSISAGK